MDRLGALIVDESKWLTASLALAALAVAALLYRHGVRGPAARGRSLAAMSLFFGVTIGAMAFGHLLAVTTKLALGTLEGSRVAFYLIGIALAVPSWWLIIRAPAALGSGREHDRALLGLNAWVSVTLLALGLHNLPLAAPGLLNVGYLLHSRRVVGWTIVGAAVVVNLGLLVGSLVFLASGQSFEQFRGMR